jgi:hypothetical protein
MSGVERRRQLMNTPMMQALMWFVDIYLTSSINMRG